MAIDTSMYNQNPVNDALNSFGNTLKLAQLVRQNRQDQAVRQAFSDNTTTDQSGNPQINQAGVLSSLYKAGAYEPAMQYQSSLAQQRAMQSQAQMNALKFHAEQLGFAGQVAQGMKDQTSYESGLKQLQQNGIDVSDAPPQYDPSWVKTHADMALTAKDRIDQMQKQQQLGIEQQKATAQIESNKLQRQQMLDNHQNQASLRVQQMLESARGNPAAAQAEKDLYAASKFDSLVNLYGDPNKLNPQQVQLAATEVAKIASGQTPTEEELRGINPSTIPKSLADLAQKVTNKPESADAGAFVKALQDYTTSLKGDAKKVIQDKYGRVIEGARGQIGDSNYNALKNQYVNRFNNDATSTPHPQDAAAIAWAKQNPQDPRSSQILKLNGAGQ